MRSRAFLSIALLVSVATPLAAHAAIPFFGPIIPTAYNTCPANWSLLLVVINNIISLLITLAITVVTPLTVAWAGFLYVVNPVDPSGISKAKGILWNTLLGIVIALSGWLIVDALMAVLYHPNDGSSYASKWYNIIQGNWGDVCLTQKGANLGDGLNQVSGNQIPMTGSGGNNALQPAFDKTGTACDPALVQQLAAQGSPSYQLSNTQANIFACIAWPESRCGKSFDPPNYNWNSAKSSPGSSAAGAFQVLLSTNHQCYENTACYQAAGVSGPLNCHMAFDSRGNPKTDSVGAALVQTCVRAASNMGCSVSAASCLLKQSGGSFSPWQADVNSQKQTGCITTGG